MKTRLLLFLVLAFSLHANAWEGFSPRNTFKLEFHIARAEEDPHIRITEFTVKDRAGNVVYTDSITEEADGAIWTKDEKYLVLATSDATPGHTKTPWRYSFYIASIADKKWKRFRGAEKTPFISSDIWTQAPDTIIVIGHTFRNGIEPPDDPVLLRYRVGELWKQLK